MKKMLKNKTIKMGAISLLCLGLPLSSFAALSTLTVINELHLNADKAAMGVSATPVTIKVYSAATKVCDSITGLVAGASFTTTATKCATFDHFVVTPMASTVNGRSFPYGTADISTDLTSVTSGTASYLVNDTGAGTAGTSGGLSGSGSPICSAAGTAAGSGDTSVPPALDAGTGIVTCQGTPMVTALPSLQ